MTFTSMPFYLFLPIVYLLFFLAADRWRWLVLLIASYGFYASFNAPYLLVVLFMVTYVSHACALQIRSHQDEAGKKRWLWIGIIACVAILAVIKYLSLFESEGNTGFGLNGTLSKAIISVGVSYFDIQAISYLVDIYLGIEEPEQHLGYYALYLAFYPKLLQGPIERAGNLLPQLKKSYQFDYDAMRSGMLLFAWGLFKKVVIADRLAFYSDNVYNHVHDYTGLPLIIGTYAYALQIYFDFSGYTDMARGTARLFGINLSENFNSPYLATSIVDFWRRWHISFSQWILDYIFKPLQMSWRGWGHAGTALALLVTFLLSGLWHGISQGFIIWGLLHGIYLAASTYYRPYQKKIHTLLRVNNSHWLRRWQVFITFNLVSFAWIFFRAGSHDGWYVATNLWNLDISGIFRYGINLQTSGVYGLLLSKGNSNITLIIVLLFLYQYITSHKDISYLFGKPAWLRWCAYVILIISISIFCVIDGGNFMYAKF
jgi:alginate O-acetyltransferase complex protein AlgI